MKIGHNYSNMAETNSMLLHQLPKVGTYFMLTFREITHSTSSQTPPRVGVGWGVGLGRFRSFCHFFRHCLKTNCCDQTWYFIQAPI